MINPLASNVTLKQEFKNLNNDLYQSSMDLQNSTSMNMNGGNNYSKNKYAINKNKIDSNVNINNK